MIDAVSVPVNAPEPFDALTNSPRADVYAPVPTLLKIDVEGSELQVLRGAGSLLDSPEAPAICLEWNPVTMKERGSSLTELVALLGPRTCYYIDDFEGQRIPFGEEIERVANINWVCNVFAISRDRLGSWQTAKSTALEELNRANAL